MASCISEITDILQKRTINEIASSIAQDSDFSTPSPSYSFQMENAFISDEFYKFPQKNQIRNYRTNFMMDDSEAFLKIRDLAISTDKNNNENQNNLINDNSYIYRMLQFSDMFQQVQAENKILPHHNHVDSWKYLPNTDDTLDRVAKSHRQSSNLYEASFFWSGNLPLARAHQKYVIYSQKVFLGGIPWDLSEQSLMNIFRPFGEIKVEWPGKSENIAQPKGYVYIIFESERQVKALLQMCSIQDINCTLSNAGNYYYKISSKRIKSKEVEVIPWILSDSNFIKSTSQKLDPTKTVFVGGLHGKITAQGLAKIMDDLFDGVNYVGIDTDKYKYPIGSGRVTFNNTRSYMRAVAASFIEIKTAKFTKKVQILPYLEDSNSNCSMCLQKGPYFCRDLICFRYFCQQCWKLRHMSDNLIFHKPLTRNSKTQENQLLNCKINNGCFLEMKTGPI